MGELASSERIRGHATHTPDPALKVLSPDWDRTRPPIPNNPNPRFDKRTKPSAHLTPTQIILGYEGLTTNQSWIIKCVELQYPFILIEILDKVQN